MNVSSFKKKIFLQIVWKKSSINLISSPVICPPIKSTQFQLTFNEFKHVTTITLMAVLIHKCI